LSSQKLKFVLKSVIFGDAGTIRHVLSIVSMSQKGLGHAWDNGGTTIEKFVRENARIDVKILCQSALTGGTNRTGNCNRVALITGKTVYNRSSRAISTVPF